MGLLSDYWDQLQDYEKAGSIGGGILPKRPDISKGPQGLLNQMQVAEGQYMDRKSDPLSYYRQNPEAQGILSVSPELDLIDAATGGGKMGILAAASKAAKDKIKGYHGSPHSFDKFDFSHMGSGEGAQAFGWGGYLAGAEGTSIGYRDALSGGKKVLVVDGVRGKEPSDIESWALTNYRGDADAAYEALAKSSKALDVKNKLQTASKSDDLGMGFSDYDMAKMEADDFDAKLNELSALRGKKVTLEPAGNMYEVEVDASVDEMLNWDTPVSQQSDLIKDAADKFIKKHTREGDESIVRAILGKDPTGEDVYELPQFLPQYQSLPLSGLPKDASDSLESFGVKGIKYADGSSRNADWQVSAPDTTVSGKWMVKDANKPNSQGIHFDNEIDARNELGNRGESSNYVVFNDKIMKIARKYGVSLPVAASMYYGNESDKVKNDKGLLSQEVSNGLL